MTGLNSQTLVAATADHASTLGMFERVNTHEPKNAPGPGLTAAVWVQSILPTARQSGLATTSARVEMNLRIETNMLAEPQDMIDPRIMAATDALIGAYSGDFDLGGLIAYVDLLGQHGAPLGAAAGYLDHDRKLYRVMTVTVPLIINDVWNQVA